MIAILTLVVALPLGYLVRSRLAAYLAFGLAFAHLYTFQTASLVMEWVNGADAAFPQTDSEQLLGGTLGYFAFTTLVYAAGLALVTAGHHLRVRAERRRSLADLTTTG